MGLTPNDTKSGRTYTWDNEVYASVTTILGVLNKPALPGWAARSVAEYVTKNFDTISALVNTGQKKAAIDLMKGAPWRQRDTAADLGTAVHKAVESVQSGIIHPTLEDERPFIESFADWMLRFKPEIVVSEGTIFNRAYNYAGTLDLIAKIDGLNWLIDVKSGKGIYPEAAMQVCAYAHGEFIGHEDGTEEMLPIIDKGAILHLRRDGFSFVPASINKEVFDSFLYCRELFRWQEDIAHRVLMPEVRR